MSLPRTPKSGKKKQKKATPQKKVPTEEEESGAKKLDTGVTPISKQLQEQKKKEIANKMEEQLKVLVRQRDAVDNKLKRVRKATKTSAAQPNENLEEIDFLELHLKILEDCNKQFGEYQAQIYSLSLTVDQRTQHERSELDFEELYNTLMIELKRIVRRLTKPPPAALPVPPVNFFVPQYLPPLNVPLPTFDGAYENWFSYKSMFQSVMARYQHEGPAIKLYHLRNSLVGKATGVIDQDIINNNDYDAAWALLVERFEDKRVIIDKHIDAVIGLPKISCDNAFELRELIDTCVKHIEALKMLELPVDGLGEQMLVNLIASRMDMETRKAWESGQKAGVLPTYAATITFLKEKYRVLERLELAGVSKGSGRTQRSIAMVIASEHRCTVCSRQHALGECEQFEAKCVNERFSHFRKFGMCFNCSRRGHRASECSLSNCCQKCGKRHSTLLHSGRTEKIVQERTSTGSTHVQQGGAPCSANDAPGKQILLPTVLVQVYGSSGATFSCRALIDSCSEKNFVTERFAKSLAIKEERVNYEVSGLNGCTTKLSHRVLANVASRTSNFETELELLVAPEIIGDQPVKSIDVSRWNLPPDVELADPTFNTKGRVDMLLGAAVFWDLLKSGRIELAANHPSLSETELGWVVGGVFTTS